MSKLLLKRDPEPPMGDFATISLGEGHFTIVDWDDYPWLIKFHWSWKISSHNIYAIRKYQYKGKTYIKRMHREIAKTPNGMVCHHLNRNTLDNRKVNLINLTPTSHKYAHQYRLSSINQKEVTLMRPEILDQIKSLLDKEAEKGPGTLFLIFDTEYRIIRINLTLSASSSIIAAYDASTVAKGLSPSDWIALSKKIWRFSTSKGRTVKLPTRTQPPGPIQPKKDA